MNHESKCSQSVCLEIARDCAANNLRKTTRAVALLFEEQMRSTGLRGTQFTLLVALRLAGPVPLSKLAELLLMDRTTLSRNLKPVERKSLVQSMPGRDQRTRLLTLTDQGEAVLADAERQWRKAQEAVVDRFGEERFRRLLEELAALRSVLSGRP